jgi:hypothetical protein
MLRGAGPPIAWDLVALGVGAVLVAIAVNLDGPIRAIVVGLAFVVFSVPAALDRTGWRVRLAMSHLAMEQRRRAAGRDVPRTPAGADRWLARSAGEPADLTRASVLLTAGRTAEAREVVERFVPASPEDRARVARMRAAIDGLEDGILDTTPADEAIAALPADLQRYHRLSLAWSVAWVEAANGRPWRDRFAAAGDGLRWADVPPRYRLLHAAQELAVLAAGLGLILILVVLGWLP